MENKTEGRKQQLTHEPENGLTDTKVKGTGMGGCEGREKRNKGH